MKGLTLLCLLVSCMAYSQDYSLFEKRTFITSKGDTLPYRILLPDQYDKSKKYPLVLFLHGGGEKGRDNEKQLLHGVKVFLDPENRKKYPCIVIAPQCMPNDSWSSAKVDRTVEPALRDFDYTYPITRSLAAVDELTKDIIKNGSVQKKQVYVTGLSMGGMGTYEIVGRNPGLFAAVVAVCGGGDPNAYSKKHAKTRFWIFHGTDDNTVQVKYSREMVDKLKELKINVKYTEYPGVGHNSWENAYAEPQLLPWMFDKP
ncbi:MAG: prolyl oligopeptidase family serine peptidase [Bacteroidota bacterium]